MADIRGIIDSWVEAIPNPKMLNPFVRTWVKLPRRPYHCVTCDVSYSAVYCDIEFTDECEFSIVAHQDSLIQFPLEFPTNWNVENVDFYEHMIDDIKESFNMLQNAKGEEDVLALKTLAIPLGGYEFLSIDESERGEELLAELRGLLTMFSSKDLIPYCAYPGSLDFFTDDKCRRFYRDLLNEVLSSTSRIGLGVYQVNELIGTGADRIVGRPFYLNPLNVIGPLIGLFTDELYKGDIIIVRFEGKTDVLTLAFKGDVNDVLYVQGHVKFGSLLKSRYNIDVVVSKVKVESDEVGKWISLITSSLEFLKSTYESYVNALKCMPLEKAFEFIRKGLGLKGQ